MYHSKDRIFLIFIIIILLFTGCTNSQPEPEQQNTQTSKKGNLIYQNRNIYGFKIAPDNKKMLIVIDNAIIIFDFLKMKPTMRLVEDGLKSSPDNILWSQDSQKATIIFTGNINRMIFIDLNKKGHIYDLYVKNLIDLAWVDNENLLYKVNEETEAVFKLQVFSKEPQLLTALKPGEDKNTKMLLLNGFNGFFLKTDDKFSAVSANKLAQPKEVANLNFRQSKGFLTQSLLLEDKGQYGMLLRKYGFLKFKEKTFVLNNSLVYLNTKGTSFAPPGVRGRLLATDIAIKKEDGKMSLFDPVTQKEVPLPGSWSNYEKALQSDYWNERQAILLKEKISKADKPVQAIMLYKLK